jgi:protein involved in polysaccharide export with SLBB domain
MKFYGFLRFSHDRLFVLSVMVGIISVVLILPQANAQQERLGVGDQVTVTVTRGGNQTSSTATQPPNQTVTNSNGTVGAQPTQVASNTASSYNTSYQNILADSSNTITVQTDKHLYKPGDSIKVSGTIWPTLISTVGGIDTVSVEARDINDSVIYSGKFPLDTNGSYSADFQLPSDEKNGWFLLETKADVNQDVLNSLTLKMRAGFDAITKFAVISPTAWPIKTDGKDFVVSIASNSDVSNVNFDSQAKKISFTVTGDPGTEGIVDITIPKSLLGGSLTVMMDGQLVSQNDVIETDTQDSTILEINYHHSSHEIEIAGTNAVPEFPLSTFTLVVALSSILITSPFSNRIRRI